MSSASASNPSPVRLRLRTLGATALERLLDDGTWEPVLRGGKPLALVVYLASGEGRAFSREQLADLLWGDEVPERARGSLRQALHTIRRAIGETELSADRELVALRPGAIDVDRSRVLQAIRADALDDLLDAYVGPFCPRLDVGRAAEFLRWQEAERAHLERVAVDAAVAAITRRLTAGEVGGAVAAARRLVAAAPDAPEAVAVLTDALVAQGGLAEARERLESVDAIGAAVGRPFPPMLRERLERLRRAVRVRPAPAVGTLEALGRTLVGREGELSTLLREAEAARAGGSRRVTLVAPAGMGKTRLLDEFEARMRLRGARVVRVRFLPGMRGVPYSGVADLVRALATLPGALGISPAAARALIGLVPELADRYPAVDGRGSEGSILARRDAVADLLAAIAEDRLVLVLVDDLHYADEASRDLLASLPRGARSRLLELFASRPGIDVQLIAPDTGIELPALTPTDVRALLAEVALLPEASWVTGVLEELVRRSRGAPQALLSALRALVEAGHLRLSDGGWIVADSEALRAAMARADGVPQALASLADCERRIVRLLATWGRPVEEADVVALIGRGAEVSAALNRLAALGLVQSRDATWSVAHDAVVEAIEAFPPPPTEAASLDAFIDHWARHPQLTVQVLEHLALLCGVRDDLVAARRLVARVAGRRRWRTAGLRGRALARTVARAAGRPAWEVPLDDAVGFLARRSDLGLAFLGAGLAAAAGALLWLLAMLQPRLVVESEPIAEVTVGTVVHALALIVQPRVAVRNGFGRTLPLSFPVRVTVPDAIVRGDSVAPLRDGRHQFERLVVERDTALPPPLSERWRVDISGPWYVRSASARIRGPGTLDQRNHFRAISLRVERGELVGPMHVRARLGDSLRFDLTFEYSTVESTANYLVAGTPTWGDRRASVIRLAGLPSPVQDAWRTVTFTVTPPPRRGMHHVVILLGLEDEAANVLSATNWAVGDPIWFDGNDIVDLPASAFERLRRTDSLVVPNYLSRFYQGRLPDLRVGERLIPGPQGKPQVVALPRHLTGTAIRIDVE